VDSSSNRNHPLFYVNTISIEPTDFANPEREEILNQGNLKKRVVPFSHLTQERNRLFRIEILNFSFDLGNNNRHLLQFPKRRHVETRTLGNFVPIMLKNNSQELPFLLKGLAAKASWIVIHPEISEAVQYGLVFFGLGHAYQGLNGVVANCVNGILFSLVYLRKRDLVEVIAAHSFFDLLGVILAFFLI